MNSDNEDPVIVTGEEAVHRHLEDDLRALVDLGLGLARAEIALQKARAGFAAVKLKGIVALGGLALVLAFFSLVALTVGLVIGLTPLLGAIGATLAVFGGLLLVALIAALVAASQWKRMTAALSNKDAA
jgi:uncharacterized membrane protein YqjE